MVNQPDIWKRNRIEEKLVGNLLSLGRESKWFEKTYDVQTKTFRSRHKELLKPIPLTTSESRKSGAFHLDKRNLPNASALSPGQKVVRYSTHHVVDSGSGLKQSYRDERSQY